MCPSNSNRNEQGERGIGRSSQCKKRRQQENSLYSHQLVCRGWNSTYASSRNHEESRVWALMLVTHQKGLATHRSNTPASSFGWREVRRPCKISCWRNILCEGNMERKVSQKYLTNELLERASTWIPATLYGWTVSLSHKRIDNR